MTTRRWLIGAMVSAIMAASLAGSAGAPTALWSGLVSADRVTDWSTAGVAGGIPTRTKICAKFSPGAASEQIDDAIAKCPPNRRR